MSCITRNNKDQITGVVLNNGKDSKLFDDLLKIHQNGTIAYNIYQQILSPAFQSIKHEFELDSNGEPVLKNKYTTSNNIESYLVKPNITTSPNTDQIIEGDIWTSNGIPIITTNLGGIHGAGLANQAYTKGYIKYKQDGDFGDRNKVITFPVKKIWSDKTDLELLKDSAEKLIELAKQNPTKKYSLPLIGLGHGEGKIEEIVPVIKHILNSTNNVKLVLPTSNTDTGKKGTARTDRSLENIDQIKKLLQEQPTKQEETKSGVSELFESNPELANQVYETLGFTGEKTIETAKGSTYRYLSSGKTQRFKKVEGKEYEPQDILTFVPNYEWIKSNNPQWLEKQGLENDTQYTQYLLEKVQGKDKVWIVDSKGKKIETNQDAKIADRLFIAFGKKDGTVEDFIPVSKEPVIGFYTYDSRIHFDEKGERYRDRHLGNKVVKITEDITPQQKATAQQLYSQYLDTIFPDSKVKDIVYHHSDTKITEFKKEFPEGYAARKGVSPKAKFFLRQPLKEEFLSKRPYLGQYLINIINPNVMPVNADRSAKRDSGIKEGIQEALDNNQDGAIFDNIWDNRTWSDVLVVFKPEQIHILGSKQDIEGFKKFVSKETKKVDKDLNQKLQNILQKLYPEIKLNITNNPIWEQGDNIFNQIEQIEKFELYEDRNKLCSQGICNYTARESTKHLEKLGLHPFPNESGSMLGVTVKSPLADFNITHYISAVAINGAIYIYDMPQHEFISNDFFGQGSDVDLKETYKPRLIPLTLDSIQANYNLSNIDAGKFIHQILSTRETNVSPSFEDYIKKNIANGVDYINLLENEIKNSKFDVEVYYKPYQKTFEDYQAEKKQELDDYLSKELTPEEQQKIVNLYENKLKLKTKEYLPKKTDKFSINNLINSVLGKYLTHSIKYDTLETTLQSLKDLLTSPDFIENLYGQYTNAVKKVNSLDKSFDSLYSTLRLMQGYIKKVKTKGIKEALKDYDSKQQYLIKSYLPSNILERYKSKEQAALVLQKYWSNKDKILKQLNINFGNDYNSLVLSRYQAKAKLDKYNTLLAYLKSMDLNTEPLYEALSNEINRRYKYFGSYEVTKPINYKDPDRDLPFQKDNDKIIGQANIKALSVLIDAVNQKQDTLPHEYAHHYIAWYRNTPIVQEAIKKWGSEEALVQSIGEQAVIQKGEAWSWWKRFTTWLLNKLNKLSSLDKQELTQILTDAFLTRQNLNQTTQSEKQTSDIWSQNKESIQSKFPDLTEDQFNQMTEQEKTKFIKCYL